MYKKIVAQIFAKSELKINGSQPYDPQIHNPEFYKRVILHGNLGLGESYMEGWWDCQQLNQFIARLLKGMGRHTNYSLDSLQKLVLTPFQNVQTISRSLTVNHVHYDLDTELYKKMLDPRMVYTCAYWKEASNLAEAQEAKLDLVCKKLGLQKGMKVLDIGCGFGSFMKFAAEKYGVECVGYTLSKQQYDLGMELCKGLPVSFVFADYRKIKGQYDRIASIGMFEAVGYKNFRTFMKVIDRCLKPEGIALLHTMVANTTNLINDPWFEKYIFPNGLMPSMAQIAKAYEGIFILEDLHNIGPHYEKTLLAWNENFQAAWPELRHTYSERFKRMWEYYLLAFAGSSQVRNFQLFQLIFSRMGMPQGNYRHC